uniref:Uncharacterized protein n=1 Tax=Kalanchoe fedtschenkoi TaxID=63787 RepID=A0A7N0UQ19_KALFE
MELTASTKLTKHVSSPNLNCLNRWASAPSEQLQHFHAMTAADQMRETKHTPKFRLFDPMGFEWAVANNTHHTHNVVCRFGLKCVENETQLLSS